MLDFNQIKEAAQKYEADMTRFLRDIFKFPGESCDEKAHIDLIAEDPLFGMTKEELTAHLEPKHYIGRCPEQVTEFLSECVSPVLERYKSLIDADNVELKV